MFVITHTLRNCHMTTFRKLLVDSRGLCRLRGFCFRSPPNSILRNHLSSQFFNTVILCTEKVSRELSLKELKYFRTTPSFLFTSSFSTIGYPPSNSMRIFPKGNYVIIIIRIQDTNVMYSGGSCPAQHTPRQASLVQDHF